MHQAGDGRSIILNPVRRKRRASWWKSRGPAKGEQELSQSKGRRGLISTGAASPEQGSSTGITAQETMEEEDTMEGPSDRIKPGTRKR
jgi:hypothetical protein